MREFHGRQIIFEDNRKIMAVYNLLSPAEVDLALRERNHYKLVFLQPIYFLIVRSKVTEPKQSCSQPEAWMFYCLPAFPYEPNRLACVKSIKKTSQRMSERNTFCVPFTYATQIR